MTTADAYIFTAPQSRNRAAHHQNDAMFQHISSIVAECLIDACQGHLAVESTAFADYTSLNQISLTRRRRVLPLLDYDVDDLTAATFGSAWSSLMWQSNALGRLLCCQRAHHYRVRHPRVMLLRPRIEKHGQRSKDSATKVSRPQLRSRCIASSLLGQ